MAAGCSSPLDDDFQIRWENMDEVHGSRKDSYTDRGYSEIKRKVLLLYSVGFNDLSKYLTKNIEDLKKGWIPGSHFTDDILLIYSHLPVKYNSYKTPTSPYLIRLYSDKDGKVISDTLVTYPQGTISASARQMNKVLSYVKEKYHSDSYGMIFSSHATGYLPAGYYTFPNKYIFERAGMASARGLRAPVPVPYAEPEYDPSLPRVRSMGQDVGAEGMSVSYEIELPEFAEAIPMPLEYIIFDACFMGGIEVAYQLKDKVGKVAFSQAEVLAEGLNYKTVTTHLLKNEIPDPRAVCEDYFTQYDNKSNDYRSATISLVDCGQIEELASVCRTIFNAHREGLEAINPAGVQRFFRFNKHWFYDLESIVTNAGVTGEELQDLHQALDKCVIYKAHTPEFISDFRIKTFSGFSMYLPCNGSRELDKYYCTLSWNTATGLVQQYW